MTTFRLKHVKAYTDRHGHRRCYFRKRGCPVVALPGEPGSKEFMTAYHAAMDSAPRDDIGAQQEVAGSLSALIAVYYKSGEFKNLAEITQSTYRNVIERLRAKHGKLLVGGIRRKHIVALLDQLADKPAAQYNLRRVLRILLKHAVEREWIAHHPMVDMRRARRKTDGYRSWTEEDIAQFEAQHPAGSRARLALYLLLYTGQRRSDVVRMGRQHVSAAGISVVQQKTGTRLTIRLHPALKAELAHLPADQLTFLMTTQGKPFSPAGFTNWFRDCAAEAGLEKFYPHGGRKASLRRLAEAGCTANQIMAVSGHKNLSEVTLYTQAADQARLAAEAVRLTETRTKVSTHPGPGRQKRRKV